MIVEALRDGAAAKSGPALSHGRLAVMAVATSLDALAVGVSFAFMDVPLAPSCLLIAGVTFVICFAGASWAAVCPAYPAGPRAYSAEWCSAPSASNCFLKG